MLVFFPTTGPWIKYTECISGSAEFSPSGSSREESDIISGWCNSLHQSVDSASQPPGRAPAGSGSRGSRQWGPYLFPHGRPLFQKGGFSTVTDLFSPSSSFFKSNTSQASPLIVFPVSPCHTSPQPGSFFFYCRTSAAFVDSSKYMLITARTTGLEKLRRQKGVWGKKTGCGTCWVYSQGKQQHFELVPEGKGCREECAKRVHHSLKDPGRLEEGAMEKKNLLFHVGSAPTSRHSERLI